MVLHVVYGVRYIHMDGSVSILGVFSEYSKAEECAKRNKSPKYESIKIQTVTLDQNNEN